MRDGLRTRLGELVRQRRASEGAPVRTRADGAEAATPRPRRRAARAEAVEEGVEAFLPGGEWRHDVHGAVYVHERLRSDIEPHKASWGRLESPPETEPRLTELAASGLGRALFLDLETCGLGGSMVFLAGTMHWNGEDFVLRQYFARHYGEEAGLVAAVAEQARGFDTLITFNGRSFDGPQLVTRATAHRVELTLPERHLDLLHVSRRRWKDQLPDCRLQTLERHICRHDRSGDVPSAEVPELYHDYVRRGDAWRLVPVFHHNLLDVITMAEILSALCRRERPSREGKRDFVE